MLTARTVITTHMGYMKSTYHSKLSVNEFLKGLLFEMKEVESKDMNMAFKQIFTLKVDERKDNQLEVWTLAEFQIQRPENLPLDEALNNLCYQATHKAQPMPIVMKPFLELTTM